MEWHPADTRVAECLVISRHVLASVDTLLGFRFLFAGGATDAVNRAHLLSLGGVGVAAFISHAAFTLADAQHLGLGDKPSDYRRAVGFLDPGVAVTAILAHVLS